MTKQKGHAPFVHNHFCNRVSSSSGTGHRPARRQESLPLFCWQHRKGPRRVHRRPQGIHPVWMKQDVGDTTQPSLRPDIAQQMAGDLLQCTVEVFLNHYSPFRLDETCVQSAFTELKGSHLSSKTGRWHAFKKRPSAIKDCEPEVFEPLAGIVKALGEHGYKVDEEGHRQCLLRYVPCPNTPVKGETPGGTFKMDACLQNISREFPEEKVIASNIAVALEFKKTKRDVQKNHWQLMSDAHFIINDDPRRIWIYGITIEDDEMSVWYFSRSHSVKSKAFDFTQNPKTLIRIFMSLLFATEEEMGFDQTVHRVPHRAPDGKEEQRYIFEIASKQMPESDFKKRYFRTIELIYSPRVTCITRRKTRVWRAEEVEGKNQDAKVVHPKKQVALKDVWIDEKSRTEKEIQTLIIDQLRKVQPSDYDWAAQVPSLRGHVRDALTDIPHNLPFMEIEWDGRGKRSKERLMAAMLDTTILYPTPSSTKQPSARSHILGGTTQSHPSAMATTHQTDLQRRPREDDKRDYPCKQQYRVVYSNVGCVLSDMPDLVTSLKAMQDVLLALVLMFLAGWVHRDVSASNIIVVRDSSGVPHGRLSDLEYAKEHDRKGPAASDPKTGTPFFMPIEIHSGSWLQKREQTPPQLLFDSNRNPPQASNSAESRWSKFRYHHDLESLMWVALWRSALPGEADEGKSDLFHSIFTNQLTPTSERTQFFGGALGRNKTDPMFHHSLGHNFIGAFHGIRITLWNACLHADQQSTEVFQNTYKDVWTYFAYLTNSAENHLTSEVVPGPQAQTDDDAGSINVGEGTKGKKRASPEEGPSPPFKSRRTRRKT